MPDRLRITSKGAGRFYIGHGAKQEGDEIEPRNAQEEQQLIQQGFAVGNVEAKKAKRADSPSDSN